MNEHTHEPDLDTTSRSDAGPPGSGDDDVRRLLETAGPRPPLPAADLEAIASAARLAWKRELRQRDAARTPWLPRPLAVALAAMLAIAVGLGGWWVWQSTVAPAEAAWIAAVSGDVRLAGAGQGTPLAVGEPIPLGAELITGEDADGRAGRAAVLLGDSVSLRLDAGTRLRLAADNVVELERGAVYVDSGDHRDGGGREEGARTAQIEVRTPYGSATDVGTRFTVRLVNSDAPGLEVRVRDGAVLTSQDGRTWRTEAGRQLTLRADGAAEQQPIDAWGSEWDWVLAAAPGFELEGKSLGELLDWVERETGWQIELADPARADSWRRIVLYGGFGRAGSEAARPDRVLFTVLPGAGLEGELSDGKLTIRAAG